MAYDAASGVQRSHKVNVELESLDALRLQGDRPFGDLLFEQFTVQLDESDHKIMISPVIGCPSWLVLFDDLPIQDGDFP